MNISFQLAFRGFFFFTKFMENHAKNILEEFLRNSGLDGTFYMHQ